MKADVTITANVSDRGVNKLHTLTELVESVMRVDHCVIDSAEAKFYGVTELKLSELTAALYSNQEGAKLLRNVTYNIGAYLTTGEAHGL